MKLAGQETVEPWEYAALGGGTVFADAAGHDWSGGRKCVMKECIDATVDKYNRDPLAVHEGGLNIDVPLSREQLFLLPYIIPVVLAALGLCGALPLCGKTWQRIPMCLSGFFICVVLPFIFLFAGALTFAMVMGMSDMCRGGWNVGYHFVSGSDRWVCAQLPNTTYVPAAGSAAAHCRISQFGATLDLDLPGLYMALLGSCNAAPDVIPTLYSQLQTAITTVPDSFINQTLDSLTSSSAPIGLRPTMMNLVRTTAHSLSTDVVTFVGDLGHTVSCPALNGGISQIKGGLCCDFATALYWFVSSWYLIGFAMCCCGFPASILGYKRFPSRLWGRDYEVRAKSAVRGGEPGSLGGGAAPIVDVDAALLDTTGGKGDPDVAAPAPAPAPAPAAAPQADPVGVQKSPAGMSPVPAGATVVSQQQASQTVDPQALAVAVSGGPGYGGPGGGMSPTGMHMQVPPTPMNAPMMMSPAGGAGGGPMFGGQGMRMHAHTMSGPGLPPVRSAVPSMGMMGGGPMMMSSGMPPHMQGHHRFATSPGPAGMGMQPQQGGWGAANFDPSRTYPQQFAGANPMGYPQGGRPPSAGGQAPTGM